MPMSFFNFGENRTYIAPSLDDMVDNDMTVRSDFAISVLVAWVISCCLTTAKVPSCDPELCFNFFF